MKYYAELRYKDADDMDYINSIYPGRTIQSAAKKAFRAHKKLYRWYWMNYYFKINVLEKNEEESWCVDSAEHFPK